MRHAGLIAFGITTAVLVPAALQRLTAGAAQVAKLVAPGATSVELGGATIDVAVDRAIVDAGGTVHVSLTATHAGEQKVTVAVLVMEATGSGGGRVETPPRRIARETVTFAAGATGARQELAFKLPGRRGLEMDGVAPFGSYTILVMAPKAADKLERMRHRAARVDNPMEDADNIYSAWSSAYYAAGNTDQDGDGSPDADPDEQDAAVTAVVGKPGETARLQVITRAKGSVVALHVPDTATAGKPYTVTVTVKNPTRKKIDKLDVSLKMPPLYGFEYKGLAEEQVAIEPADIELDLGAQETRQVSFTVTASAAGVAGLYAQTMCGDSEAWEACARASDGALDATDILPAEGTGTAVAAAPAAAPAAPVAAAPTAAAVAAAPAAAAAVAAAPVAVPAPLAVPAAPTAAPAVAPVAVAAPAPITVAALVK